MEPAAKTDTTTYLTFVLDGENFAVQVVNVREVLDVVEMCRIPRMPAYMRGVINLRGSVVPVVDMRLKLEMEPADFTVDACIIVLEAALSEQVVEVGILVDSVQAVCEIRDHDIEPSSSIGMKLDTNYVKALGKQEEGFTIILDLDRIFMDEGMPLILEELAAEPDGASLESLGSDCVS